MPHLDKTGPDKNASKEGRKLGLCVLNESETTGILGIGEAKRRHTGGGTGKGKRLKYNNK